MISENARIVLEKRYFKKDKKGNLLEDVEGMFRRVANNIASIEKSYDSNSDYKEISDKFYGSMVNLDFIPNSPALMNAGTPAQMLFACFLLPVEDSMESIFQAVKDMANIQRLGGGTGMSFSNLRPAGDLVKSTTGIASGPVSFMRVFNETTEAVKQGGKRRGASIAVLDITHPDIIEFIQCKANGGFANFNISVGITDEFMEAVKSNTNYFLINPQNKKPVKEMNAKEVFDLIVKNAHKTGDPGLVFLDEINRKHPLPDYIPGTNPCGEIPLLPYESCVLGSINLSNFINENEVDWDRLDKTVEMGVRFLDNSIDANKYPIIEIEEMTKKNRKIGLGIMGWADLLYKLGITYGTKESLDLAEKLMKRIQKKARKASSELGKERGNFPNFSNSSLTNEWEFMRNATVTTIAPTGSISIIAGCSSGIEPNFGLVFTKHILDNQILFEVNNIFENKLKELELYSDDIIKRINKTGSIKGYADLPQNLKDVFVISHDISADEHIKMQASFQKYICNSISKTINFPYNATEEDVRNAYLMAYDLKCKGITIYRDGSKDNQVLQIDHKQKKQPAPRKRHKVVRGITERINTGCGHLYVTINEDDQGVCEVLTTIGKAGGCANAQSEAISRLISINLRSGLDLQKLTKHLKGIRCNAPAWEEGGIQVLSCPDAIGTVIQNYLSDKYIDINKETVVLLSGACPECGGTLEHEEGCSICKSCGFSRCS